ncbi:transposase [Cohaesibacter sp. ES.047]|uniref:transposase n=1 Tax=Cohaesibacter sp. ES.047 TaxID=1798205 RepID=UPI003529F669
MTPHQPSRKSQPDVKTDPPYWGCRMVQNPGPPLRTGKATTATAALEHALISRFGTLGRVDREFQLRSDNGLVFTSRHFTAMVRSYGLKQEFITPHYPQQNGMVERVIRTMKEQCIHRHRFETIKHANRVISDWIAFYNNYRPHQALAMRTPAEAFKLAA